MNQQSASAAEIRAAADKIRAEVNAGRLGHVALILRDFEPDDRDRISALLERGVRRRPKDLTQNEEAR